MIHSPGHSSRRKASNHDAGMQRFNLYKPAFVRISKALDGGFYVDAICILESLISDRLESYFLNVHGVSLKHSTLGSLIHKFNSGNSEIDRVLFNLVTKDLDIWRVKRNKAVHGMVKLEEGKFLPWEERVQLCEAAAKEGLSLFREIDAHVRRAKQAKQP